MDKYRSFQELKAAEAEGTAFRVVAKARPSPFLVMAPHGGRIEPGTSSIAELTAGREHSLYIFEGMKGSENGALHITSHRFDEPTCLELLEHSTSAIAIHGCAGSESRICLGGLDAPLMEAIRGELVGAGLPIVSGAADYPGMDVRNVCNRARSGRGVQVEISLDLRSNPLARAAIAVALRAALDRASKNIKPGKHVVR